METTITLQNILIEIQRSPILLVSVLLTLGVIFVNGWTDAPNAIATAVSTRSINVSRAIAMAAVCNFVGVVVMTYFNSSVAFTIKNMVNFGSDTRSALIALAASLAAIVIWAVGAWYFGIPTSESHSLIAGLSGAAIALGGVSGVNLTEWVKVLYGLVLSTVLGFGAGFVVCRIITLLFENVRRRKANQFFDRAQILGAAAMAFMHGAQDGQKFIGVLLLAFNLAVGITGDGATEVPVWLMLLCSAVMGLGTAVGGKKIIKSVGMDMVKLEKYQGFASDMAAALCLLLSTLLGIPVSTTHMKTAAIMGVGAEKRMSSIKISVVKDMVMTWVCTFPGCGILGYIFAKIFLYFT